MLLQRGRAVALAVAAAAAAALSSGCTTLESTESAVLLGITAADPTILAASIGIELDDAAGGTNAETFTDIGSWPVDPAEHTVLLMVTTPEEDWRDVTIDVYACDSAAFCTGDAGASILASGSLSLTFLGGEQLDNASVVLH